MIPGEVLPREGELILNEGQPTVTLTVSAESVPWAEPSQRWSSPRNVVLLKVRSMTEAPEGY